MCQGGSKKTFFRKRSGNFVQFIPKVTCICIGMAFFSRESYSRVDKIAECVRVVQKTFFRKRSGNFVQFIRKVACICIGSWRMVFFSGESYSRVDKSAQPVRVVQ